MALYNEILAGRYNKFLTKLFSMKGGAPSPQLASEISVSLNLFTGIENRFLETWGLFAANLPVGPTAGVVNNVMLRNPPGSGVIGVVEGIIMIGGAAASVRVDVQYGQPTVNIGGTFAARARDGRINTSVLGGSTLIPSFGTSAFTQIGTTILSFQIPTGNMAIFPTGNENQELVLSPGDGIDIQDQTVNNALIVSLLWRERSLEESERK